MLDVTVPNPKLKPVPMIGRVVETEEITVVEVEEEEKGTEIVFCRNLCVSRRLLLATTKSLALLSAASFSRLNWASCSGKDKAPLTMVSDVVTGVEAVADVVRDVETSCGGETGRGGREATGRNWHG